MRHHESESSVTVYNGACYIPATLLASALSLAKVPVTLPLRWGAGQFYCYIFNLVCVRARPCKPEVSFSCLSSGVFYLVFLRWGSLIDPELNRKARLSGQ